MYRNKRTPSPKRICNYFQLREVCGRWISKGGMPELYIYNTGKYHYRIKFSYNPDTTFNCRLRRIWGATYFYLYGSVGVLYEADNEILTLSDYGDYIRAED